LRVLLRPGSRVLRLPREAATGIAASEHDAVLKSRRAEARLVGDRGGARRVLAGVGCSKPKK